MKANVKQVLETLETELWKESDTTFLKEFL